MVVRAGRLLALAAAAFVLLLAFDWPLCRASSRFAADERVAREEEPSATILDKFVGLLGWCDMSARLDNLAIELQQRPKAKAFILVYTGKYNVPDKIASYREHVRDYLVNSRGIEPKRLSVIDAGYRQELTTELWIAPKRAPAPEPTDTINAKEPLDKAFLFAEQSHYFHEPDELEPIADDTALAVEETAAIDEAAATDEAAGTEEAAETKDEDAANQTLAADASETAEAPTEEESAESQEETNEPSDVLWQADGYAAALQIETGARGCIIFYADRGKMDFSRMQELVERGKNELSARYGVAADRLLLVFGGYRRTATTELWIVPANVSAPAPTPDTEKQQADEQAPTAALPIPAAP